MTALARHAVSCKSFGGLRVTADVDLAVEPGERRLIIGPNGAGKTTLFNLITGEIAARQRLDQAVRRATSRARRAGAAPISAWRAPTRSSRCSRATPSCATSPWRCSDCRRCAGTRSSTSATQHDLVARAHAALARVGLDDIADRPLAQTSYGERRRVEIAMALAQNPKVLLLDEPFAGLSIDERRDVQELLRAIPRDVTIVMIEHNMDVALDFADRITLLHFGEVIVEGTRAEVVADPRTREVYLGD